MYSTVLSEFTDRRGPLASGYTNHRTRFVDSLIRLVSCLLYSTMELSAEALRVLHPREVYSRFVRAGVRPDGRVPTAARKIGVNASTLACDGSSIVRLGGTTVAAGVQVVLAPRVLQGTAVTPITVAVQVPAACSSRFRRTASGDPGAARAAVISDTLAALLRNPLVVKPSELVVDEFTVFHLDVDAICTTFDGNVEDATILAVVCAIASTTLPAIRQRTDKTWEVAGPRADMSDTTPATSEQPARRVRLGIYPVPLSFSYIRLASASSAAAVSAPAEAPPAAAALVADPTAEEEELSHGRVTVIAALSVSPPAQSGESLEKAPDCLLVRQSGGPVSPALVIQCIELACARAVESRALLSTV
jgi:exosome complex RNA-binding protein Rrp42 (RNase PH superfamily)